MTNEEKFKKGIVVEVTSDNDYILELWGASTKHPDSIFKFSEFVKPLWYSEEDLDYDLRRKAIFQWLIECASKLMMPYHTKELIDYAIKDWWD